MGRSRRPSRRDRLSPHRAEQPKDRQAKRYFPGSSCALMISISRAVNGGYVPLIGVNKKRRRLPGFPRWEKYVRLIGIRLPRSAMGLIGRRISGLRSRPRTTTSGCMSGISLVDMGLPCGVGVGLKSKLAELWKGEMLSKVNDQRTIRRKIIMQ
jgi:hypothetical protein